jgi:hypothetical protein
VALVITDVSEEYVASIFKVGRICEIRAIKLQVAVNVLPSSLSHSSLIVEAIRSSETSVLIRSTRYHIAEDDILRNHRRENSNLTLQSVTAPSIPPLNLLLTNVQIRQRFAGKNNSRYVKQFDNFVNTSRK